MGLSGCTKISQILFSIINFIFLLVGISVLGVGIYLQVESDKYDFITGDEANAGPALLIASGCITCVVTGAGLIGALLRMRPILVVYAFLLGILVVLQLASGILGAVYRDTAKSKFEEKYNDRLFDAIEKYTEDSSARKSIDYVQKNVKCCGVNQPSDWAENGQFIFDNNGSLPDSCMCNEEQSEKCDVIEPFTYKYNNGTMEADYDKDDLVWTEGCYNDTITIIEGLAVVYGGFGLAIGLFEIIGIVFAVGLIFCITKTRKDYEVV